MQTPQKILPFWILLLAAGIFTSGISLLNQFAFDDLIHIVGNRELGSWNGIVRQLHSPLYPGNLYRPLVTLVWGLLRIASDSALPFHLLNVATHIAVAFLVFHLLKRVTSLEVAQITSLLFITHPVHSEAIANITGGFELASTLLGLLGMLLVVHFISASTKGFSTLVLSSLVFLGSFLSKESALTFILLTPLLVFSLSQKPERRGSFVLSLLSPLVAAGVYLTLRYGALGSIMGGAIEIDPLDNPLVTVNTSFGVLNSVLLLGKYIGLILFPALLRSDYSYATIVPIKDLSSLFSLEQIIYALLVGVSFCLIFVRNSVVRLFSLWFFVAFLITSNLLFPIGTIFAERLLYLPSVGALGLIALCLTKIKHQQIKNITIIFILGLSIVQSNLQNFKWYDNQSLLASEESISQQSAKSRLNLAMLRKSEGRLDEAQLLIRESLKIAPRYADAAYGMGALYLEKKIPTGARHWFNQALKINPAHTPSLIALGRQALLENNIPKAEQRFLAALRSDGDNFEARSGLLAIRIAQGRQNEARELYEWLKARDPDNVNLKKLSELGF